MLTKAGTPVIQSQNRIKKNKISSTKKKFPNNHIFFLNLLLLVSWKGNHSLQKHLSLYICFLFHSFLSYAINARLPLLATRTPCSSSSQTLFSPLLSFCPLPFSQIWLPKARGQEQAETDQTDKARSLVSKQGEWTGWNYTIMILISLHWDE